MFFKAIICATAIASIAPAAFAQTPIIDCTLPANAAVCATVDPIAGPANLANLGAPAAAGIVGAAVAGVLGSQKKSTKSTTSSD